LDGGGECLGDGFDLALAVVLLEGIDDVFLGVFHNSSVSEKRKSNNRSRWKQGHFSDLMRQP
jgi:hypothetical protein